VSFLSKNIIDMKNIIKSFYIGTPNQLNILKGIDITVKEGEFVSIIGTSGSGKSTLMNIIGALDRATSGEYKLEDTNINDISDDGLSEVRNKQIGFVFQTYNLIPRSSALSNVELPMLYFGMNKKERRERAEELLDLVGMKDRMSHQPNELSGGQKQRVAIARALANDPSIILADEPTGALDTSTGRMVMDLFHKIHEEEGKTIVLITHNTELADETQRIITLRDGEITSINENKNYYRRYTEEEEVCL
jgi:putative ABC transport system ATP-binding protein